MKETPSNNSGFKFFAFICPQDRTDEALGICRDIKGVSVSPDILPTVYTHVDPSKGEVALVEGSELIAIGVYQNFGQVINALADAHIAGFPPATQVVISEPFVEAYGDRPIQERPVYLPELKFEQEGLFITFDPSLRITPKNFGKGEVNLICFAVNHGQEIFAGLRKLPKHVLRKIIQGLECQREHKRLTKKQMDLVNLGISRLEDIIGQIN